ncbi:MFS transporter [Campylobacter sp. MIT 97-5078]|uniref:MFS transporter n=1 Tax=Campylobacter sp. MIT 97-5078 TaxID=1548153 RepID=UPI0005131696|nr:MFS transporter [Campylobacter sp. MIT 97-5078]KGI55901.1 MFS transporter [Campylobacter sp. MIT 97-5078]KGI57783.1 MFS transporter [Campylobacter sp. MIT 97-5078]TQR23076.1 MFS transporter [Campylobacter sp. MIT 97-5078]
MGNFKKNLLICWFGVFTTSMGLSQLAPILPFYIRSLGVSEYGQITFYSGLCFGITALMMTFCSPFWGHLTNRFGSRLMLLRASFGMAFLTLFLAFVQNVEQIIIIRALTGLVSGFTSAAIVYIALISPKEKATYALATLSTASVSGNLIGPLFGGLFAELVGIRALFVVIATLLFCSFLTTYFFIKDKGRANDSVDLEFAQTGGLRQNLSLLLTLFALTFIIQVGFNAVMPIMSLFVEQIHHSARFIALWAGLVVAASGVSNIIFAPKLGKIADKIGAGKVLLMALAFCAVIFYLHSLVENIITLIFLRLLLGVGLGGLVPCVNALFKKIVPQKKLGLVFGFNQSAFALGNFIGSVSGGFLAGLYNIEFVFKIISVVFLSFALYFAILQRKSIFA